MNLNLNDYRGSDTTPDLDNYDVINILTLENEANALFVELHELEVAMQLEDFDTNFANEVIEASTKFRDDPAFNSLFGEYLTGNEAGEGYAEQALEHLVKEFIPRKLTRIEAAYRKVLDYIRKFGKGVDVYYANAVKRNTKTGYIDAFSHLKLMELSLELITHGPIFKALIVKNIKSALKGDKVDDIKDALGDPPNDAQRESSVREIGRYRQLIADDANLSNAKRELSALLSRCKSKFADINRTLEADYREVVSITKNYRGEWLSKDPDTSSILGGLSAVIDILKEFLKVFITSYRAMRDSVLQKKD